MTQAQDTSVISEHGDPKLLRRDPKIFYTVVDVAREFYEHYESEKTLGSLMAVIKFITPIGLLVIAYMLLKQGLTFYAIATVSLLLLSWMSSFLMPDGDKKFEEAFIDFSLKNGLERGDAYEFLWDMNWDYIQNSDEWLNEVKAHDLKDHSRNEV